MKSFVLCYVATEQIVDHHKIHSRLPIDRPQITPFISAFALSFSCHSIQLIPETDSWLISVGAGGWHAVSDDNWMTPRPVTPRSNCSSMKRKAFRDRFTSFEVAYKVTIGLTYEFKRPLCLEMLCRVAPPKWCLGWSYLPVNSAPAWQRKDVQFMVGVILT